MKFQYALLAPLVAARAVWDSPQEMLAQLLQQEKAAPPAIDVGIHLTTSYAIAAVRFEDGAEDFVKVCKDCSGSMSTPLTAS